MIENFAPVVYRDLWADDERLIVDGKDVTTFRGVLSQVGGYSLQEPFAYGPGDFAFPQVTEFEAAKLGKSRALKWLRTGARVELVPVTAGVRGEPTWRGIITQMAVKSNEGVTVHCDGDLSGRLALRDRQAPVFVWTKDIGLMSFDNALAAGVSILPYLGPKTGIRKDNRGGGLTRLDYATELLSEYTASGNQWTIARDGRRYRMRLKDTTTIHATVFLGAEGFTLEATDDMQEHPNVLYGTGTDPRGQKWVNAFAPNLLAGPPANYPFNDDRTFGVGTTDADTDTGAGITAMHRKLVGHGFMTRADASDALYDADTARAVRTLQRRGGLAATGNMNPATWRKLYSLATTGRALYGARVLPLAQDPETQRYTFTANGSVDEADPRYDPRTQPVDRTIDHGAGVWKADAVEWSERFLDRLAGKRWFGTMDFDGADLFAGDVSSSTVNPAPISRRAIREGWNIKVVGFDGNTVFHVSGVNFDSERNAHLAVDTKARDLPTLGAMIARHKESRRNRAREFAREVRRGAAFDNMIIWSEIGGLLDGDVHLKGGQWNKVPVVAGQSGTVERIRVNLNPGAEFVMGVTAYNTTIPRWTKEAGAHPLTVPVTARDAVADDPDTTTVDESKPAVVEVPEPKWIKSGVQERLKKQHLCLYSAGQGTQPLGYYPGTKFRDVTDKDGNPVRSSAALSGRWEDDAGFAFRTYGQGVLYLWFFPDRDCTLQAGQILYPNQTEGA